MTTIPSIAILLVQVDEDDSSKVWSDYKSYEEAIEELMQMVEDLVKHSRSGQGENNLTYSLNEYLTFFDKLKEVVILTSHPSGLLEPIPRNKIRKSVTRVFQNLLKN
jgi:vacuolar-type H+-ATPase subunit E/Vma4